MLHYIRKLKGLAFSVQSSLMTGLSLRKNIGKNHFSFFSLGYHYYLLECLQGYIYKEDLSCILLKDETQCENS